MSEITPLTKDQLFEKKIAENTGSDYNVGDISDVVPVTKDQSFLKEIALNSAGQSEAIEATQGIISDAYDPTATYAVGDYCIYNDVLYRCNTAIATGEAFTPAKWDATNVAGAIEYATRDKLDTVDIIPMVNNSGYIVLTFSGMAFTRIPHYIIMNSGQSGVSSPVVVGFGGTGGDSQITSVFVSPEAASAGFVVDGLKLKMPQNFASSWGFAVLLNLKPNNKVAYTVSYE